MRSTFPGRATPWILALTLLCLALGPAAGPAAAASESQDEVITARVAERLADHEDTAGFEIAVETVKAVVTLRGEVDSDQTRRRAGELALSARGVKEVRNAIKVVASKDG